MDILLFDIKIVISGLDRSMVPLLVYIHLFSMKKESAPEISSQDLQIINEVQKYKSFQMFFEK